LKPPKRHIERDRGIALIAVLCVLSLLTALAIGALEATRRHGQLVHRSIESAQASELADSAIRVAIVEMTAPPELAAAVRMQGLKNVRVFGDDVEVRIEREMMRVDLNTASEEVLASALSGQGLGEREARTLAARIVDWRDVDDEPSAEGAERTEYRRAGRDNGPRNGPFETVSELRQVLGADGLTDPMLNALTLYSHAKMPDKNASSMAELGVLAGEVVRLSACATTLRTGVCRVAIVRLTGNRTQPVLVYSWRTQPGRVGLPNT
jgi:general secretion pathway protein K